MFNHETDPHAEGTNKPESKALVRRQDGSMADYKSSHEHHHSPFNEKDGIDFRAIWNTILKRKWTVLTFFAIVVITATTTSFMMTPIYSSTIVLQIDRQESKIVEYKDVSPSESGMDAKEFYATQYELLKSRSLAERIINQLNLTEDPTFSVVKNDGLVSMLLPSNKDESAKINHDKVKEMVIDKFISSITITPVKNSKLVKISFESPNPKLAEKIANTIAATYINLNLERRMDASSYAKTFLTDQLAQTRARLEEKEKEMADFARDLGLIKSDKSDELGSDTQVLMEYTTALAKAEQERIKAESIYKQMQASGGSSFASILESAVIQSLKARKSTLEAEYQDALQIYKPDFPTMLQKESQLKEIQQKIDEEVKSIKTSIQMTYEAAKAEESALRLKRDQTKEELLAIQDRGIRYSILKREVDTNRQLYEGLLQRLKEVGVAGGIGLNNISVVDKAQLADSPIKPKILLNILIAAILGLIGGILLVLFIEMIDDTIKGSVDFEKIFGIAVLGIIPFITNKNGVDGRELVHEENLNLRSAVSEAFRSLRTSLQFSTPGGAPKVILFTSASAGEGKSTTSLSIAIQFAQAGKRVLIVDMDLRKATLHNTLGIANEWGITNYLAGDAKPAEITRKSSIENLFIVPSGPLPPNPAELISSGKMFSFLSLAVEKFDIVILDGPPVLGLADALLLGNLAETTVFVVQAESTRIDHVRSALKRLRSTQSNIIGGVITKVNTRNGGYGYGYNNYYEYGK